MLRFFFFIADYRDLQFHRQFVHMEKVLRAACVAVAVNAHNIFTLVNLSDDEIHVPAKFEQSQMFLMEFRANLFNVEFVHIPLIYRVELSRHNKLHTQCACTRAYVFYEWNESFTPYIAHHTSSRLLRTTL